MEVRDFINLCWKGLVLPGSVRSCVRTFVEKVRTVGESKSYLLLAGSAASRFNLASPPLARLAEFVEVEV